MAKSVMDTHHICYSRKSWNTQWAHKLREHPYMKVRIPRDTLHRQIHDACDTITPPPEWISEALWFELEELYQNGIVDRHDNIHQRLTVLLAELSEFDDPELGKTVDQLLLQKRIVHRFYTGD